MSEQLVLGCKKITGKGIREGPGIPVKDRRRSLIRGIRCTSYGNISANQLPLYKPGPPLPPVRSGPGAPRVHPMAPPGATPPLEPPRRHPPGTGPRGGCLPWGPPLASCPRGPPPGNPPGNLPGARRPAAPVLPKLLSCALYPLALTVKSKTRGPSRLPGKGSGIRQSNIVIF